MRLTNHAREQIEYFRAQGVRVSIESIMRWLERQYKGGDLETIVVARLPKYTHIPRPDLEQGFAKGNLLVAVVRGDGGYVRVTTVVLRGDKQKSREYELR